MNKKQVWHVTTATHNSRYSERMMKYRGKTAPAIWLDKNDEIIITETLRDIVKKDNLKVLEYNICGDHLHLLIVCEKKDLAKIVGKIKSMTARACNIARGVTTPASGEGVASEAMRSPKTESEIEEKTAKRKKGIIQNKLWTERFGKVVVSDEKYLKNVLNYIKNNRKKHQLPQNIVLEKLKKDFLCTLKEAFQNETKSSTKELKIIVISPEKNVINEMETVCELFENGLDIFHLRKPSFSREKMEEYLINIPKKFHGKIMLHTHHELAKKYDLKGVHGESLTKKGLLKSKSCHSPEEIEKYKNEYDYLFISPIFDSISKKGYKTTFSEENIEKFVQKSSKLVALGGISSKNIEKIKTYNFFGAAVLGTIWEKEKREDRIEEFKKLKNSAFESKKAEKFALAIAGFDPSSGAGITQDIKTMQTHEVYGMGVTTATTIQNDTEFENVFWEKEERILEQIKILQKKFDFSIAKIGLVENFEILEKIVAVLHEENKNIKIIWDPILKASAGFSFHEKIEQKKLINLLNSIFLVTPNIEEHKMLFSKINPKKIKANILKKGGHSKSNANDILLSEKREFVIEGKRIHSIEKHGTGCVLSSTIASQLLLGKNLKDACIFGKKYMEKFIQSTEGHLGIHEKN